MTLSREFDTVGFIMAYEGDGVDEETMVDGFQEMIDKGIVWELQGTYGRQAARLIEAGHCVDTHGVLK